MRLGEFTRYRDVRVRELRAHQCDRPRHVAPENQLFRVMSTPSADRLNLRPLVVE